MSWYNGAILHRSELQESTAVDLPANHQVAQEVRLWLEGAFGEQRLPCVIVGIHIGQRHAISYDLAFRIQDTEFYSVVKGVRGNVTALSVGAEGEAFSAVTPLLKKPVTLGAPKLSIVPLPIAETQSVQESPLCETESEPLRLYAWQPKGFGEKSFFVMAHSEKEAYAAVEKKIAALLAPLTAEEQNVEPWENGRVSYSRTDFQGWGTDYYELTVLEVNQVILHDNE